ncbi:hypothetical protein MTO96_026398 [Rhipicephalus appendiculatus]
MPVRNAVRVVTHMSPWGMSCSGATGPITRGYVMIASLDAWLGDCEKRTGTLKKTLDHLLLHCSGSGGARIELLAAYAKHGLPRATAEHLLFPQCRQDDIKRVMTALLDYLGAVGLRQRL